jgi:hypothetical protein
MRFKRSVKIGCFAVAALLFVGCGKSKDEGSFPYQGKWAYNHDLTKAALKIDSEGNAKLDGKKYTCREAEDAILLESEKYDTVIVKFKDGNDEDIMVYKPTVYVGQEGNEGLIGTWVCDKWNFVFTDQGTFLEDGYFPGYYVVDYENSAIMLIYNDQFSNTVIPFELTEEGLVLDYPWEMIKI